MNLLVFKLLVGWTISINCSVGVDENQLLHLAAKLPVGSHSTIWMCGSYYTLSRRWNRVDAWRVPNQETNMEEYNKITELWSSNDKQGAFTLWLSLSQEEKNSITMKHFTRNDVDLFNYLIERE